MSDNDLRLNSHKLRGRRDAWWYEEPKGICVVIEFGVPAKMVEIPWREIRRALARKDTP